MVSICNVADRQGVSAEVISDHYVGSEAYWRHEQDILFDVVRVMKERHRDVENYPELMQLQLTGEARSVPTRPSPLLAPLPRVPSRTARASVCVPACVRACVHLCVWGSRPVPSQVGA